MYAQLNVSFFFPPGSCIDPPTTPHHLKSHIEQRGEGGQSCSLQPFFYLEVVCEMVAWWPLFPWQLRSSNLCPQHLKRSEMLFLKDKMETKSLRVGKRISEFSHRSHAQIANTFAAYGTRMFGGEVPCRRPWRLWFFCRDTLWLEQCWKTTATTVTASLEPPRFEKNSVTVNG